MKAVVRASIAAFLLFAGTAVVKAQTNAPAQTQETPARKAQLAKWKAAIEDVFSQRLLLRKKFLAHKLNKVRYAAEIAKIDTTACPKSFRLAWLHYAMAWQKLSTDPGGIVPLVELVVEVHTGHLIGAAHTAEGLEKNSEKKREDAAATRTAMIECQEVAIKYNASFTPD